MTIHVSEAGQDGNIERAPEVDVCQPADAWARTTHEVLRQRFGDRIPRLPGSALIQIDREIHETRPLPTE